MISPRNITAMRSLKREDVLELFADKQDGAPRLALAQEFAMHEFDDADIDAARRLVAQKQTVRLGELAGEYDLLGVAAGEPAARHLRPARHDRIGGDRFACRSPIAAAFEKGTRPPTLVPMLAEDQVLRDGEIGDQAVPEPVARHIAHAPLRYFQNAALRKLITAQQDAATVRPRQTGDRFEQFVLAIAGDAGDAENFACPRCRDRPPTDIGGRLWSELSPSSRKAVSPRECPRTANGPGR